MSNEISNQRFYMFLSSFENNGGWVSHADQDGDNYIMQCEFYDFITKEWDGEKSQLKPDLINRFWNTLDTNKEDKIKGTTLRNLNALDKKEMEKLETHLASYVAFDTFFGQGGPVENEKKMLQTKGIITDTALLAQWKGAIKDELSVLFFDLINQNPDISDDEVHNKLNERFNEIKTGITAEYIAIDQFKKAQDTILKGLDYNINNDEILLGLINSFVEKYLSANAGNVDLAELKKGIINIINQYLEKAGFDKKLPGGDQNVGDEDIDNINNLGFDNNTINDLQIAKLIAEQKTVIRAKVDEILKANNVTNSKHDYYSDMTKLVTAHIQDNRYSLTFDELKAEVANFDYETPLVKLINFDNSHDNLEKDSDLYSDIKTEFDETFANYLAENDTYLSVYESIIASAREEYINGNEDVDSYIINQIKLRFPEFYPNGMDSKEDVTTLNSIYKNFEKSAEALDAKEGAERVLNAAMMYCEALVEKNPMYNITIKEVFGTVDYKKTLEAANTNVIKNYMDKLTREAINADTTNPLDGIETSYNLKQRDEKFFELSNTNKDITFSVEGCLKYDSATGKVSIITDNSGNFTGTINMMFDGVVIATKNIKVHVEYKEKTAEEKANDFIENVITKTTEWADKTTYVSDTSSGVEKNNTKICVIRANTKNEDKNVITAYDFKELYYNNDVISVYIGRDNNNTNWNNNGKNLVKDNLRQLGQLIKNTVGKTLDESKFNTALDNTIAFFIENYQYEREDIGKDADNLRNAYQMAKDNTEPSLMHFTDEDSDHSNYYMINFKFFVDKLFEEYFKLV